MCVWLNCHLIVRVFVFISSPLCLMTAKHYPELVQQLMVLVDMGVLELCEITEQMHYEGCFFSHGNAHIAIRP